MPAERHHDYLVRLAHNEPGPSRLLVRELRELGTARRERRLQRVSTLATLRCLPKARPLRLNWNARSASRSNWLVSVIYKISASTGTRIGIKSSWQ
jgi:hypothetical protein